MPKTITIVEFFRLEAIPSNLSGERTKPRFIQKPFDRYANPNLPTVFD
jgi:hypothetical protein